MQHPSMVPANVTQRHGARVFDFVPSIRKVAAAHVVPEWQSKVAVRANGKTQSRVCTPAGYGPQRYPGRDEGISVEWRHAQVAVPAGCAATYIPKVVYGELVEKQPVDVGLPHGTTG